MKHDSLRQADLLRQTFASDRQAIGLFIGAGCPVSIHVKRNNKMVALIPDIAGLTKTVSELLSDSDDHKDAFGVVRDNLRDDGLNDPNIEEILNHIRALAAVAGKESVRGLTAEQLDQLDRAICEQVVESVDETLPSEQTPYAQLAMWLGSIVR